MPIHIFINQTNFVPYHALYTVEISVIFGRNFHWLFHFIWICFLFYFYFLIIFLFYFLFSFLFSILNFISVFFFFFFLFFYFFFTCLLLFSLSCRMSWKASEYGMILMLVGFK